MVAALATASPVAAAPAQADETDPAQELADRYAPVVMLRTQPSPCSADGEPYFTMSVDAILGNPQIALRLVGNGDPVVMWGPTASDLHGRGEGFYLDFPGSSLRPGCLYEQDHHRFNEGRSPVVYAHVATQADAPGKLALQYWLYWYYNAWNNVHESDWEFVQLVFDADTVEAALASEPVEVGYAQHEGGERADWDAGKLEKIDGRPVVYSSQRSHASYFQPAVYMGRGATEGFGCDNTTSPSTRTDPQAILLPDRAQGADDPFAWLDYEGRWGERQSAPNNGPTGPNTKDQWTAPITWQEGLRDSSVILPGAGATGDTVTNAFCGAVGWGSAQFNRLMASPMLMLGVLALIVALVGWVLRRTEWGPNVDVFPLVERRRGGQIVRAAATWYRHEPATVAAMALLGVPIMIATFLAGAIASRLPLLRDVYGLVERDDHEGRFFLTALAGSVFHLFAFTVIMAGIAAVLSGQASNVRDAARVVHGRMGVLIGAFAIAFVAAAVLNLVVVGIPIAVWLVIRWQFLAPAVIIDERTGLGALGRSSELVKGRWLNTLVVAALVIGSLGLLGLAVALVVLLLFQGLPIWMLGGIATTVSALAAPLGATVMVLLYGDAVAERTERDTPETEADVDGEVESELALGDAQR